LVPAAIRLSDDGGMSDLVLLGRQFLDRATASLPADSVLVHNNGWGSAHCGFRAWFEPHDATMELCDCGFAPGLVALHRGFDGLSGSRPV